MVEYTWTETATDEQLTEALAEALDFFESATDAQQEMQVVMRAFESLHSKYEADVAFGKEVFRLFQEAIG